MEAQKPARSWALIVVMSIVIVFSTAFLFMLFNWQPPASMTTAVDEPPLAEQVALIMPGADAARGEQHINTYACVACHVTGAANHVAPAFAGLGSRAATRRPPLTAEEYLYESIVHPAAFLVEGYPNSMLQDFGTRMTHQEIGDVIAYLLTLTEEATPEATPAS